MGRQHRIRQGESVASLAAAAGHAPATLWQHPANAALREKRASMNVLSPGDEIFIPDVRAKSFGAETGKRYRFRLRGVPAVFRLRLLRDGEPRRDLAYRLEVAGAVIQGRTDARGVLVAHVPPDVREMRLFLDGERTPHLLRVGNLDPVDDISGLQQRLENLGVACVESGVLDDGTRSALRRFQRLVGLAETGEPDAETRRRLQEAHDRMGGEAR